MPEGEVVMDSRTRSAPNQGVLHSALRGSDYRTLQLEHALQQARHSLLQADGKLRESYAAQDKLKQELADLNRLIDTWFRPELEELRRDRAEIKHRYQIALDDLDREVGVVLSKTRQLEALTEDRANLIATVDAIRNSRSMRMLSKCKRLGIKLGLLRP